MVHGGGRAPCEMCIRGRTWPDSAARFTKIMEMQHGPVRIKTDSTSSCTRTKTTLVVTLHVASMKHWQGAPSMRLVLGARATAETEAEAPLMYRVNVRSRNLT